MSSTAPQGQRLGSTTAFGGVLVGVAGFLLLWSGVILLLTLTRSRAGFTPMVVTTLGLSLGTRVGLLATGLALLLRSSLASGAAIATLAGAAASLLLDLRLLFLNPPSARVPLAYHLLPLLLAFGLLVVIAGLAAGALLYLRRPPVVAEFHEERPAMGL